MRFQGEARFIDPSCRYVVYPGHAEIRMTKTSSIETQQFIRLLPREYLISYLSSLFNNNASQISLG